MNQQASDASVGGDSSEQDKQQKGIPRKVWAYLVAAAVILGLVTGSSFIKDKWFPSVRSARIVSADVSADAKSIDVAIEVTLSNGERKTIHDVIDDVEGEISTQPFLDEDHEPGPDGIRDLDGVGFDELVIGTSVTGDDHSMVICYEVQAGGLLAPFDKTTIERKWHMRLGNANPYASHQGDLDVHHVWIADVDGDKETKEVIAVATLPHYFPTYIAILKDDGNLHETQPFFQMAGYWHPGNVSFRQVLVLDKGTKRRLLFTGHNNDFGWLRKTLQHHAVVFWLESDGRGQLPPFLGNQPGATTQRYYPPFYANLEPPARLVDIRDAHYEEFAFGAGIQIELQERLGDTESAHIGLEIASLIGKIGRTDLLQRYGREEVDVIWMWQVQRAPSSRRRGR